ncbi:MAG TPA: GGDEF domain-containing protein [Gemmatimonadaceae bacterium]|nr:GGDEF domain-containing protein [Gemmatimonadaceae bacterium]
MAQPHAIYFSPDAQQPPDDVRSWCCSHGLAVIVASSLDDLMARALRGRPRAVIFEARNCAEQALAACARLKGDSYTAVVPGAVLVGVASGITGAAGVAKAITAAFEAGADEVLSPLTPASEGRVRLDAMLRRAERDVRVHPSTRLPGAPEIEGEIARRIALSLPFAVCYADLDHFKEYNDRYSYFEGDRVIRLLAKVLHDVVRGLCPDDGFVGHIGGDDFIFVVPHADAREISQEIITIFDALVPYQYSEQDRNAGYFFGKDRRGQLHRVPLMTLSIGIVTNERRTFAHAAQVSELATEMKSYAKTLPGSVFVVDRRHDSAEVGAESVSAR